MTKPLVFCNATFKDRDGNPTESWELIPIAPSPVLHAVWDIKEQQLVIQFNSVKENIVPMLKQVGSQKNPKQELIERRSEQYYITRIGDVDAIQAILDNFVVNYDKQEWKIEPEEIPGPQPVESEV